MCIRDSLKGGSKTISTNNGEVTLQLHTLLVQLAAQLGLQQQFESVQSKLQGSTGEVARGAVQEKLGVKPVSYTHLRRISCSTRTTSASATRRSR